MSLLIGVLAPAAIALALVWLLRRGLVARSDDRTLLASAAAAAVFIGYVLLPEWAVVRPQQHWQWLPYVAVAAAAVSALAPSNRLLLAGRWLLLSAAALLAAWKLVPTWETLYPPRPMSIALLAVSFLLLTAALEALPDRLCVAVLPAILAVVAAATALVLAAAVSFKFGQLAGLAAGALAGVAVAGRGVSPAAIRGLMPIYVLVLGGVAYVASVEPDPPLVAVLALPLAPLALWMCAYGPLAKLQGLTGVAAQVTAVLIPLAIAGGIAVFPRS